MQNEERNDQKQLRNTHTRRGTEDTDGQRGEMQGELLNEADSQAATYPVGSSGTERGSVVGGGGAEGTQMEKGSSDGTIGELIEGRLGKREPS